MKNQKLIEKSAELLFLIQVKCSAKKLFILNKILKTNFHSNIFKLLWNTIFKKLYIEINTVYKKLSQAINFFAKVNKLL